MAQIELVHVSKTFGGTAAQRGGPRAERLPAEPVEPGSNARALDDLSLTIADGETVCVIGPSGCGKSSLLRVIAGLEQPDEGQVLYDGQDMRDVAPGDRGIGMVFQNYALYPHMKSRGNLDFFFRLRKRELEVNERVRITSEIMGVGFDELLDRKPKTLSGGQQQRVAIARCIVRDPRLFLFDEPLSNLDAALRSRTRVEIKRLLTRFQITAVYVTHDQTEAIALASRIAVMRQGRIEQIARYRDLYDHPINRFVATFAGLPPATLVPGVIAGDRVLLPGGSVAVPDRYRPVAHEGLAVDAGLRPDHVQVTAEGQEGHLAATVDVVEPRIAERYQLVHARLIESGSGGVAGRGSGGADDLADHILPARGGASESFQRGDAVQLTVDAEGLLLFNQESGRNLLA